MTLQHLHDTMAWPRPLEVIEPSGAGPRLLTDLAREKIGGNIKRLLGGDASVRVGLLTKNPSSSSTQAPIAVVCEFSRPLVSERIHALAHRLAWNFARSPLLVTIEPHQVRTWTCCEAPPDRDRLPFNSTAEIEGARLNLPMNLSPTELATHALHWVRLATGDFFRQFPQRFGRDGRADHSLLRELSNVRQTLLHQDLANDTIHDLIARVVFVQFLFDRKDIDGRPALNPTLLSKLRKEGYLTKDHSDLGTILSSHDEAYRFFRWLNNKFNGDLFPGKGQTEAEREVEWHSEMDKVKPRHLRTLADFVSGRLHGRQRTLWPLYSFDVIPLEFISSIYEEFVAGSGTHFTPPFLVDFMLDEVLPWNDSNWNLKILDPACGSGIFLVKAYQRLIWRWKEAHPGRKPTAAILRRILERNLFGVDIDRHAVRVASFSLYLAMCDEIDPKSYLKTTRFPRLRERSLVMGDFFSEDVSGVDISGNSGNYDIVIGNAPWGRNTLTDVARLWARHRERKWPVANTSIGTLFLAKAALLTAPNGRISMIQPASQLLFNRSGPASRFRKKLFSKFKIEEIVNLSPLRFELFKNATSPPCILTMRTTSPDGQPFLYISPKQIRHPGGAEISESSFSIIIEPHDISPVWPEEAASEDASVWTALAWAGRRDLALINKLSRKKSLKDFVLHGIAKKRNGIERGSRSEDHVDTIGWPILETEDFPTGTFMELDASNLPKNCDQKTHRLTDLDAFRKPQILIKRSLTTDTLRFKAALGVNYKRKPGIICSQNYVSVHAPRDILSAAALAYNSVFAVYYLLLTSGRMAAYRPNATVEELLSVPLPVDYKSHGEIEDPGQLDSRVRQEMEFKDAEWVLIEDLVNYTLPDFKGSDMSPGRQPTERRTKSKKPTGREPELSAFCQFLIRVLKAGFGVDKKICATIFQDPPENYLPVRCVAIHLNLDRKDEIIVESIGSGEMCQRLLELDGKFFDNGKQDQGGILFQRTARVFADFYQGDVPNPTIYVIKPDRKRYWTRSVALRDADEIASDLQYWNRSRSSTYHVMGE